MGRTGALPKGTEALPKAKRRGVVLGKITDEVLLNCLDLKIKSIYVGRTGVSPTRILPIRPHDGGVSIIRDGNGITEKVTRLFIRRLDFISLSPTGPGSVENIGGTGIGGTRILCIRPHDGGVPITGDLDGIAEKVTRLFIRRLDFLLLAPIVPGPGENISGTSATTLSQQPGCRQLQANRSRF